MRTKILKSLLCAPLLIGVSTVMADLTEVRSIDGTGNNLLNPTVGAAGTRVIRFGYEGVFPGDGTGATILGPLERANPRTISNRVSAQSGRIDNNRGLSDYVWLWGQFLDHDLDLTLSGGEFGTADIPIVDPADPMGPNPMRFNRSKFDRTTGRLVPRSDGTTIRIPREQINEITSYIDASQVYGSDATRAAAVRTFSGGRLVTTSGNLLPFNTAGLPNDPPGASMFLAGDIRANENVGLTSLHTLFVREHNRLAGLIATTNPSAGDEEIYQTARKIVGAEMQRITYNEFLPALLGDRAPRAQDVAYDPGLPASITNSFAHALYRFGHSMLSPDLQLADHDGTPIGSIALRDAFNNPGVLAANPQNIDFLLRGAANQRAEEVDTRLVDDVRNFLFGPPGAGGLDLASLNIQRGRDHGLPDYNSLREAYHLDRVTCFEEITSDPQLREALTDLYGSIDNIDAWVGGLAEDHLDGASVGELINAVVGNQFERLRDGDRLFYLTDPDLFDSGSLHDHIADLVDLGNIRLSDVITFNTGITDIRRNVFFVPEPATGVFVVLALAVALGRRDRGRGQVQTR